MRIFGKVALGLFASFVISGSALAQEPVGANFGNTTVTIGGGTAVLDLPDVAFTTVYSENSGQFVGRIKDNDDFSDEIGYNINGSIATPIGANKQAVLSGFFAQIENDDSSTCFDNPSGDARCAFVNIDGSGNVLNPTGAGDTLAINTDREVDQWGVSLEARMLSGPAIMGVTQAPSARYFAVGADIRGIDQDTALSTRSVGMGTLITYDEDLDTRYYGGYLAYGGDYTPFLFGGLWQRWGLQSSFQARAGVYHVDADYSGRMATNGATFGSLNLSEDDIAFIGGLSLTTSKQISPRAAISLRSDYEYYSWVPEMAYANNGGATFTGARSRTAINDDDAYAMRTSLRLTIKLGPDSIMEPYK